MNRPHKQPQTHNTPKGKINLYRLAKRVENIEKDINRLHRINQVQTAKQELETITIEEILIRLQTVERVVILPDDKAKRPAPCRNLWRQFVTFLCQRKDKTRKGVERYERHGKK